MRKLLKFIVRKVPRIYLIRFSYAFSWIIAIFYKGEKHHCPICGGNFRTFLPYGYTTQVAIIVCAHRVYRLSDTV